MNKLNREDIKSLLILCIGIALIIIAIRFFIYLLPFIIIALIALYIYDSYKKNNNFPGKKKDNKNTVKEAQIIKEKKKD